MKTRGLTYEEHAVGATYQTLGRTVSEADICAFVNLCGFNEPLVMDMEYVAKESVFKRRAAPGAMTFALSEGLIKETDIAGEIGEVVTGRKPGRTSDDEITIFDSTGIALQDSATVPLEYERAMAAGVGIEKKMIST